MRIHTDPEIEAEPAPIDEVAGLVEGCRAGRPGSFDELVALTEPGVRRLMGRLLGARADLDDALQETYLRAWRSLSRFRGDCRFATWLHRIAVNVARNRGRGHRPALSLSVEHERSLKAPEEGPDESKLMAAYETALQALSPALRAVFVLHEGEGMTYQQVADTLGCPIGTVMSRLHRARSQMLGRLRDQLEELTP